MCQMYWRPRFPSICSELRIGRGLVLSAPGDGLNGLSPCVTATVTPDFPYLYLSILLIINNNKGRGLWSDKAG
jgi:hypothetical protein